MIYARVRDPRTLKRQRLELGQAPEMLKPGSGDFFSPAEIQSFELGQALKVFEASIGNWGTGEVKLTKTPQRLQIGEPRIRDIKTANVQYFKVCNPLICTSPASATWLLPRSNS